MDLERLKGKRATIRQLFTKLITKIDSVVQLPLRKDYDNESKIGDLHELKNQLIDKMDELKKLDTEIELLVELPELEKEISASDKYRESGITSKTKIDRCLKHLERVVEPAQSVKITENDDSRMQEIYDRCMKNENRVIKLPRLNISKFSGADCSEWLDFWNSYEVAIHNNDSLNKIEKFTYLKSYLSGAALTAISGFAITNLNYDSCISLLKERFGRTDLIISSHMNKLLLIEPVKSVSNVVALRKMYDAIEVQVRSLESLNVAAGTYTSLLCPVILQKIPEEINLQYNRQRKSSELFDVKDLIDYLRREIECRETAQILGCQKKFFNDDYARKPNYNNYHKNKFFPNSRNNATAAALFTNAKNNVCIFCFKSHAIESCPFSVDEKISSLKAQGRCYLCFGRLHLARYCKKQRNKKCEKCNSPLHSVQICKAQQKSSSTSGTQNRASDELNEINSYEQGEATASSLLCKENKSVKQNSNSVFLQTFTANVNNTSLRCILDGGSTRCFVLRQVADSLKLRVVNRETLQIYPFGNTKSEKKVYDVVEITLSNQTHPKRDIKIQAIVTDHITLGKIEVPSTWVRNLADERGIELADLGISDEIHLLIGSDFIWDILKETNIRLSKNLVATDSIFGFVIQGKGRESRDEICVNHLIVEGDESELCVSTLWDLEAIGINLEKEIESEDTEILEAFEQNTTYKDKRYETRLLWKEDSKLLKNNFEIAKRRLFSLNNTFRRNEKLYLRYRDIINEQLNDNIIEYVEPNSYTNNGYTGYFMPHHGVVRESKETTKVRICYDASSKAKNELSLNDCLDSGPNLNPDLLEIILKFRYHPIAFCADIQRAFLEVGINEEDRKFLQFLWGNERGSDLDLEGNNIRHLRMRRVPFGVKCSPYLLAATIRFHLKKFENCHPEACTILNELYVDDLISGSETIEKAALITKEAVEIMKEASMNLRQWTTNSPTLLKLWLENEMQCRLTTPESRASIKVLGLNWDNYQDTMRVSLDAFNGFKTETITKRTVLRTCGMIFDPLGLLSPFTIRIKLLIQTLWEKKMSWDEAIPRELETGFRDWIDEVENIKNIVIPRQYFVDSNFKELELHLFSDASPKAYGAVGYFRVKYHSGEIATSFVIAKSRLAPMKALSLPRLELMAALISARLSLYLRKTFKMLNENNIFFWCDSQITLHWIRGEASQWKQFVRNRVSEIKEKTNVLNWNFCEGKENVADEVTRGVSARSLIKNAAWLSGPSWLLDNELIINSSVPDMDLEDVEQEKKRVPVMMQSCQPLIEPVIDLEKYSNLNKILRITAYVLRFVNNATPNSIKRWGTLSTEELLVSEAVWVKLIQQQEFAREYKQLHSKTAIDKESKLIGLDPILSDDGTLRLGGRLQHSKFLFQQKHPWILPNKSRFSELLIMREHENVHHSGVNDTLTQIRENYWIIRGRQAVKSCLNKCLVCRKYKVTQGRQVVAPLPPSRTHSEHAFEIVGIDFAGPLYTRDWEKVYIALFTCATTRAIHLEIVSSLSTEHFLLSFRRFVSRRGLCRTINSDNALTFKCADSEIKKLYEHLSEPVVLEFFGKKGIAWQYIVEKAAWWGGYWERMVRITKMALRKILGKSLVSVEELQTLLTEIEATINSRPLTFVYNEPNEPFPLTPAHFLVGKRLTFMPQWTGTAKPVTTSSKRDMMLKRFLYRERLLNQFWSRWRKEYILQLKSVNNVNPVNVKTDFNVNDVVLVGDDKIPRNMWKMGRITAVHLGRDQRVRSVTLKLPSGIIRRPIQLLYKLELDC